MCIGACTAARSRFREVNCTAVVPCCSVLCCADVDCLIDWMGPQVIFALPAVGSTDFTMRIFNSDGSEPEMCGNGIRCLARFVADVDGQSSGKCKIHTLAGE